MSFIIYIETNWIIGAVMGQDPRADDLLLASVPKLQLAMPSVCLMEAIKAFDRKLEERRKLKDELAFQLAQVRRSAQIEVARELAARLIQAELTNDRLLDHLYHRLDAYLVRVGEKTRLIQLSVAEIRQAIQLHQQADLKKRSDALILACVLGDAETHPSERKAFLTGDTRDFDTNAVRNLLAAPGIKLFSSTEKVLAWSTAEG